MLKISSSFLINILLGLVSASGELSCLGEDNLLTVVQGVDGEGECDLLCSDTDGCVLFTWELYAKSLNSSSGFCLLYSHCELIVPGCLCKQCSQCITGVASTGTSCDIPAPPNEGSWHCAASPICSSTSDQCSSLSCSLSCSPGRAPYPRSLTTCVGGSWSTEPSSLQCDDTRYTVPLYHIAYSEVTGYWRL